MNRLIESINQDFDLDDKTASELLDFITVFVEKDREQYKKNKENKALTFGKYKGYTVKELSLTMKGKDYLGWLLNQTWCTEDKFTTIHEECATYNIVKKKNRPRASLD